MEKNVVSPLPAPCVPYGLTTYIQCEASLGAVSWSPSDGAESYMAVAVGTDGLPHMCTTNSNTCTWDNLLCGDLYVIQVIANDHLCSSSPSNSTSIHTGKHFLPAPAATVIQSLVPVLFHPIPVVKAVCLLGVGGGAFIHI